MFHLQMTIKKHIMKAALKRGVETGTLVMVKSSYKVSAEAKKAPAKKPAAKKVAKAATKKVRIAMDLDFDCRSAMFSSFSVMPRISDEHRRRPLKRYDTEFWALEPTPACSLYTNNTRSLYLTLTASSSFSRLP
jgi:hypothetical protein